jgi:hypothetical protein
MSDKINGHRPAPGRMPSTMSKPFAHLDRSREIALAHGGGGQLTDALLQQAIVPRLDRGLLGALLDSATLTPFGEDRPALTIDGYVVTPWQFPAATSATSRSAARSTTWRWPALCPRASRCR